jgi:SAM-dependent methyltransferase
MEVQYPSPESSGKKSRTRGYVHGYSETEKARLLKQAGFLETPIYHTIDLNHVSRLLEIGCGVGAQTAILLRRFPHLKITAIDAEKTQVEAAAAFLKKQRHQGSVELKVEDASSMGFKKDTFDGAFICWLLEHVEDPLKILTEAKRVLKRGATIYCTEVLNSSLYLSPSCPATMRYWEIFNTEQLGYGGDPFVGAKLGNLLIKAGFNDVKTHPHAFHFDARVPEKRRAFLKYWTDLLNSGAPALLDSKKAGESLVAEMNSEMKALLNDDDAVFFYVFMQAKGIA